MDKISAEQMGEAVIKLMRLAQTALDAGRIADASRLLRLAAAASEGFEIRDGGFSLAGPRYYERFRERCVQAIDDGVGFFKFDGIGAKAEGVIDPAAGRDFDAMLKLIAELRATSELLDRQRPLRRPTALGGEARDESTLIDHLCSIDGLSGDLVLPLKATLSRTHLLTKINFLRGFVKATSALHDVPTATWRSVVTPDLAALPLSTVLVETARAVLDRSWAALAGPIEDPADPGADMDVWPCLAAAMLDPTLSMVMPEALCPGDVAMLRRLADVVADPAAALLRYATDDPRAGGQRNGTNR